MTRLTRKLMISILTVVLSISALGTTTFAWFTLTNVATVDPFSANMISDAGIEISLDGKNWYNSLSETVVQNYITAKYTTFAFNHVTSQDGENFYTLGTNALTDVTLGNGHLEIVVFFRTASVDSLIWTDVSLTGSPVTWNPDVAFTASKDAPAAPGTPINVNPANAMRVSVYSPEDTLTTIVYERQDSTTNTVLGSGGDLSNGGIGDGGAMNYYYAKTGELPYGLGSWVDDDADELTPDVWVATPVVVANAVTTLPFGVGGVDAIVMNFQPTDSTTTSITYDDENYFGEESVTINYGAAFGGYIVINVWFEGYDAEAYNSLLAKEVTMSLEFKGYPIE